MPLYDYQCTQCKSDFELLIRQPADEVCPNCGAKNLQKKLSAFATKGGASGNSQHVHSSTCGCGNPQGSCHLN